MLAVAACLAIATPSRAAFDRLELFDPPNFSRVHVSPGGEWIVAYLQLDGGHGIAVQRRGVREAALVYRSLFPIVDLQWIGSHTLYALVRHEDRRMVVATRLSFDDEVIGFDNIELLANGRLVAALPEEEGVVLWSRHGDKTSVLKGPIDALQIAARWKVSGETPKGRMRVVAQIRLPAHRVLADRDGVPRAAIAMLGRKRPKWIISYRASETESWREVYRFEEGNDDLDLHGFNAAGDRLIISDYAGNDSLGLHEFDPEKGEITRELLVIPGADVVSVLFNNDGTKPIAALYLEAGVLRTHYLDGVEGVPEGFEVDSDVSVFVSSSDLDRRVFSLFVQGPNDPGTHFYYDVQTGLQFPMAKALMNVPYDELLETVAIDVTSFDGTKVEAFLTKPESEGSLPPLVVMPHGGPIGVVDSRSFNPLAQFLALRGIAVLQVNYRGSAGYGKEFLDAGKHQWSGGIEKDIYAAARTVVDRGLVDGERVCIEGGSYGGYSALMSSVLYPDFYDCAATLNGVTDVPLLFQSSDYAATSLGKQQAAEIIGDPQEDYPRLVEISPVYRVSDLRVPVLIGHGDRDVRVHPDHAWRLRMMLDAYDREYEWIVLGNTGHAPGVDGWKSYAARLGQFLDRHLFP